jgi:L-alanine-DL-glutamate epimerase-like enolase superfamily enzyme
MRVSKIEAIPVEVPRAKPLVAAGTRRPLVTSRFGIVILRTEDGVVGLGEISMNGGFDGALMCPIVDTVLAPRLVGARIDEIRSARELMDAELEGVEPAKAAVEMALWDALGRTMGVPVFSLLGGKLRESVPIRWGIGFGDPEAVAEEAVQRVSAGFEAIKVKAGRPGTGEDERTVAAVRAALGDDIAIMIDANSAFQTVGQALTDLRRLESYGLQLIEQPLARHRLPDLAELRHKVRTPILLDESMRTWWDAYEIARHSAADVVSVYLSESGGILAALDACTVATAGGMQTLLGSQCELGIATSAMAHLGVVAPGLSYQSDATGHLRYRRDVIQEQLDYRGGHLFPSDAPGLGVTLDLDRVEEFRIRR